MAELSPQASNLAYCQTDSSYFNLLFTLFLIHLYLAQSSPNLVSEISLCCSSLIFISFLFAQYSYCWKYSLRHKHLHRDRGQANKLQRLDEQLIVKVLIAFLPGIPGAGGPEWFWFSYSRYKQEIRSSIYSWYVNKVVFKSYLAHIPKKLENHQLITHFSEQSTGWVSQLSPNWTEKVIVYCIFVSWDRIGQ